jgi:hypothetical protein
MAMKLPARRGILTGRAMTSDSFEEQRSAIRALAGLRPPRCHPGPAEVQEEADIGDFDNKANVEYQPVTQKYILWYIVCFLYFVITFIFVPEFFGRIYKKEYAKMIEMESKCFICKARLATRNVRFGPPPDTVLRFCSLCRVPDRVEPGTRQTDVEPTIYLVSAIAIPSLLLFSIFFKKNYKVLNHGHYAIQVTGCFIYFVGLYHFFLRFFDFL